MADAAPVHLDSSTRLAVERTAMAAERTQMAWVRTATSLISFGFTFYKFFELELKGTTHTGGIIGPQGFASILICTGLFSLLLATLQHRHSMRSLQQSYGVVPRSVAGPVSFLVGGLGVLALIGVILRA
jgi:inner membrane protein YidH